MNDFEYYMARHDFCEQMALLYAEAEDTRLTVFYMNAALGFKTKAERKLVSEVA